MQNKWYCKYVCEKTLQLLFAKVSVFMSRAGSVSPDVSQRGGFGEWLVNSLKGGGPKLVCTAWNIQRLNQQSQSLVLHTHSLCFSPGRIIKTGQFTAPPKRVKHSAPSIFRWLSAQPIFFFVDRAVFSLQQLDKLPSPVSECTECNAALGRFSTFSSPFNASFSFFCVPFSAFEEMTK